MAAVNGYFKLANRDDGLYATFYPEQDGGRPVSLDDFMFYLERAKVRDCNLPEVKKAIRGKREPVTLRIGECVLPINEFGYYKISSDFFRMVAVFYPGFEEADSLSKEEILRDIESYKVKYGIDEAAIDSFLTERHYCQEYEVAKAKMPIQGRDAKIEYKFETDKKPSPKVNEDGSVDFFELDNINHVKAGDVLAVLTPEYQGEPGMDILGRTLLPRKAARLHFKFGKNIKKSEDGLQLISDCAGHVSLEGDTVFVSNVLEVVNVDTSTGNIDYAGNVVVSGNVCAGFSVKAEGDVEVRGIVEGATIIAGGNITLVRGVQGMNRAVIECKGNMVTKFIESAEKVVVSGNLDTDSILHSKVEVKGCINVSGKNGLIIGGDVRAAAHISAKTIGNAMGTATTVGVGVDPSMKRIMEQLKKDVIALNDNKVKLSQMVTMLRKKQESEGTLAPDKLELLQKTMRSILLIDQQMSEKRKELDEYDNILSENDNARIKISRTIYPGTKVIFADTYMFIREEMNYCQFVKRGADIKNTPL